MTLDQLNYLLVLAEEQNVTRAAQRLYITQPTLTNFITKLEKELGTKLFDRSKNPVKLTENGKIYINKMHELVLAEQQLKNELKYHDSCRKRIRIGIGYTHSAMWSCGIVKDLLKEFPELDVQVCEGKEKIMLDAVKSGDIDLFFGHCDSEPAGLQHGLLFDERIVLLVPRSFLPDDVGESPNSTEHLYEIAGEILAGRRMILPGESMGLHWNVELMREKDIIRPSVTIRSNNMISGAKMVASGLGYMLGNEDLLTFLREKEQREIVFCVLPGMSITRKYYYAYPENSPNLKFIEKTIAAAKKVINT